MDVLFYQNRLKLGKMPLNNLTIHPLLSAYFYVLDILKLEITKEEMKKTNLKFVIPEGYRSEDEASDCMKMAFQVTCYIKLSLIITF